MKHIKMPIYYLENRIGDDVDRYDFEEMADALEESIKKLLKRDVLVTIYELRDEWEEDDE